MTAIAILENNGGGKSALRAHRRVLLTALSEYAIAIGLCVAVLIVVLKLWHFDFSIPVNYEEDSLMVCFWSKTIHEFGWYMNNPRLGAPFEFHMGDFPMADGLHQLIFKLLCLATTDYVVALNMFFLLTFPLTSASSLFVFRRFGVSFPVALVGSLLFAFLPYHFYRNIRHVYLVSYYIVPLSIMVVLWLCLGRISYAWRRQESELDELRGARRRWFLSIVICGLQGMAGVYYAFFACYLLLISGIIAGWKSQRLNPILTALVLVSVTCVSLLGNLAPHLLYRIQHGENAEVAERNIVEAERYGLKMSQLVLPVPNHRFGSFAGLENEYSQATDPSKGVNENRFSSLGAVGALGFIVLLCRLFRRWNESDELVDGLSKLNLAALLLGTIGGGGALFSLLISPMIRGYNRISVYIAFFSFFMVCLLLEQLRSRLAKSGRSLAVFHGFVCLVLVLGLLDIVPRKIHASAGTVNPQFSIVERWKSDAEFFQQVESAMPDGTLVFQYPHMNFPESPPLNGVASYDNVRGYLHTDSLRWSFPMRGRRVDLIIQQLMAKPIEEQLKALALGGFRGVYVDRRGYVDNATELESNLSVILKSSPIVSRDGTMSFFSMIKFARKLESSMTTDEWDKRGSDVWNSPVVSFGHGFYSFEQIGSEKWRWCGPKGTAVIQNHCEEPVTARIEFDYLLGQPPDTEILLQSSLFNERISASQIARHYSRTLEIPPGNHAVEFTTNAKPLETPHDSRQLVFQVRNFRIERSLSTRGDKNARRN